MYTVTYLDETNEVIEHENHDNLDDAVRRYVDYHNQPYYTGQVILARDGVSLSYRPSVPVKVKVGW